MRNMVTIIVLLLTIASTPVFAQDNISALMPMVNKVVPKSGSPLQLQGKQLTIQINSPKLMFATKMLQRSIQDHMGLTPTITNKRRSDIQLILDPKMQGEEHYTLEVNRKNIQIKGATEGAILYGIMTLDQIFIGDVCHTKNKEIAQIFIDDEPRYPFRGLMLDPARNFLPAEDVKFFIDQMVRYKFNVLQLHLTDDQGWRMKIKTHPGLTTNGSFYTQDELKEIIHYAAQRNIEVVPELDIPGHVAALLAAYPSLACTHRQNEPILVGKTLDVMLCAANERVYQLYKDIIKEVAEVFPSPRIHLGGDEAVIDKNWIGCERCQAMMKELGYTKGSQLMTPFFDRMISYVKQSNKELMLWCELDNIYPPANDYLFPYANDITLISWRGGLSETCLELTGRSGNPVIMAPGEYAYLDYPQYKGDLPEFNNWGMPTTTLEQSYKFDPAYGAMHGEEFHVQGILGTLWAEAMKDINRVTYMAFPRAMALSEAGWTKMSNRGWDSFVKRMYPNINNLMKKGVSVRIPFEIVKRK